MFQISRKVEYALMAVTHLLRHPEHAYSSKELAEHHGVSHELLSRALQSMARGGILQSSLGAQGGDQLRLQALEGLSFLDFYEMIEGPLVLVRCQQEEGHCDFRAQCSVESPLQGLQERFREFCSSVSLLQLLASSSGPSDRHASSERKNQRERFALGPRSQTIQAALATGEL